MKRKLRQLLSLALTIAMVLSLLGTGAWAAEDLPTELETAAEGAVEPDAGDSPAPEEEPALIPEPEEAAGAAVAPEGAELSEAGDENVPETGEELEPAPEVGEDIDVETTSEAAEADTGGSAEAAALPEPEPEDVPETVSETEVVTGDEAVSEAEELPQAEAEASVTEQAMLDGGEGNGSLKLPDETLPDHLHGTGEAATRFLAWNRTGSLPSDPGYYALTQNVTISEAWKPSGAVHLCLNGHSITRTGTGSVIIVENGAELHLYDCDGETVHRYAVNNNGLAVVDEVYGTKTFTGGFLTGGSGGFGGGVHVEGGSFVLQGGTLLGCEADSEGGGVYVKGGSFTMNGGAILGNTAAWQGGGVYLHSGSFEMNGGAVTGNVSYSYGSGVSIADGVFTMNGGSVTGNVSAHHGGGVDYYGGSMSVSGSVTISGNTVGSMSRNLAFHNGRQLTISGPLNSDSVIGVGSYVFDDGANAPVPVTGVFTVSGDGLKGSDCIGCFTSDNESYLIQAVAEGEQAGALEFSVHEHYGQRFLPWTRTDCLPAEDGAYFLTADVTLDKTWTVPTGEMGPMYLCLAGHSITSTASCAIYLPEDTALHLSDDFTGTMAGTITCAGGTGVSKRGTGILALYGGCITGCATGVEINGAEASLILSGGTITNNTGTGLLVGGNAHLLLNGWDIAPVITGNGRDVHLKGTAIYSAGVTSLSSDARLGICLTDGDGNLISGQFLSGLRAPVPEGVLSSGNGPGSEIVCDSNGGASMVYCVSGVELDADTLTFTYGDADTQTLTATVTSPYAPDTGVSWNSSNEAVATVADGVVTAHRPGSAVITVTTNEGAMTDSCTVTVNPAQITVSGITAEGKTYDGTTRVTLHCDGAALDGKLASDDLAVTAEGAFTDAGAGTDKTVKLTKLTLTGADADCYVLAQSGQQTTATASIDPVEIIVSGITAKNRPYDGTTAAPLDCTAATLTGKVAGDALGVTAVGSFDSAYAAPGKTVTLSALTLTGAARDNYRLALRGQQETAQADITPAQITITADDQSTPFQSALAPLTYQVSGVYADETELDIRLDTAATAASPVGTYPITVRWSGNANYTAAVHGGTYTIARASAEVSVTGYSGTYDGQPHGIRVTVKKGLLDLLAERIGGKPEAVVYYAAQPLTAQNYRERGTAVSPTRTEAGELTVYYYVESGSYTSPAMSGSETVSIAPKEVGLKWSGTRFTYDGRRHTPTATATGLVGGDRCAVTVTGGKVNAGSYTAAAAKLSNANYKLPDSPTRSFTIAKAAQTAPKAPVVTKTAGSSITVQTEKGLEYRVSGGRWQSSGTFKGLKPGTGCTLYARRAADANHSPSPASTGTKARTLSAAILMQSGTKISENGRTITVKLGKVPTATAYDIYVQYCGEDFAKKPTVTTTKTSVDITKVAGRAVDTSRNFKVFIVARDGGRVLGKTTDLHGVASGRRKSVSDPAIISVKKASLTLRKGQRASVGASVTPKRGLLSPEHGAALRYVTSDSRVVMVDKNGRLSAKGPGVCTVQVIAFNGLSGTVVVTVK